MTGREAAFGSLITLERPQHPCRFPLLEVVFAVVLRDSLRHCGWWPGDKIFSPKISTQRYNGVWGIFGVQNTQFRVWYFNFYRGPNKLFGRLVLWSHVNNDNTPNLTKISKPEKNLRAYILECQYNHLPKIAAFIQIIRFGLLVRFYRGISFGSAAVNLCSAPSQMPLLGCLLPAPRSQRARPPTSALRRNHRILCSLRYTHQSMSLQIDGIFICAWIVLDHIRPI